MRIGTRANVAETPGDDLLLGLYPVLHSQSERQLSDWIAYGKVTTATRADAVARPDAAEAALVAPGTGNHLNQMLRGHYAYYGIAGNLQALQRVHRAVERYCRKMLSSRSWDGEIRWEQFQRIKEQFSLLRPNPKLPTRECLVIVITYRTLC